MHCGIRCQMLRGELRGAVTDLSNPTLWKTVPFQGDNVFSRSCRLLFNPFNMLTNRTAEIKGRYKDVSYRDKKELSRNM